MFWAHERVGLDGRRFRLYKLRTMAPDAEQRKLELAHLNVLAWPDFKIPNDPRITRVGRWLRRTSLDELPQLWNVARGDMTLVGPRACSVTVDPLPPVADRPFRSHPRPVRPRASRGTRPPSTLRSVCRMDIRQIRSPGFLVGLRLVAKTPWSVARLRGDL